MESIHLGDAFRLPCVATVVAVDGTPVAQRLLVTPDLTSAAVSEDGEPGSDEFDKLMWSLLIVEPNRFFPLHAHPQGEVIYVVRGA